ncbi:TRAP transporter substrate-binding protein [Limimaricola pyoseonensis]|uniref:Tripartite ATP-independent transporter solute receptor, DctP family n=1 Tax=Limimaricola pyoseonensis TaxID=521013 RepID=A0A1G7HUN9_9RHOB|nr:TRAP transporter substrate-binding protein [Limimaricola pyoseonensis]SDF04053.1 tripartite ATP-independent transporter solute receptor, DctP family [Limimaricola pyoseonensis]
MRALPTILASALALTGAAGAAQALELRFGHIGTEDTAYHLGAERFAERLSALTDGEITVEIFANAALGGEGDMFEQQMAGALDLLVLAPQNITDFAPTANVFSIPFLYRDTAHWEAVLTGEAGAEIGEAIHAETGVKVLGYFGGGQRHVVSTEPVETLAALDGLKLRTNPTKPLLAAWSSLGVQPAVYNYQEIYTGLQLGAIDGLLNEPEWILRMRFHEVAPHIGLSGHDITVRPLTMSGATWDALDPAQQEAVATAAAEASAYARELQLGLDAESLETLKTEGAMTYDLDKAEMIGTVEPAVAPVVEEMGLSGLVARIKSVQ